MRILDQIASGLVVLILFLFLSGGVMIRASGAKIEFSQVNAFAALLLLIILLLERTGRPPGAAWARLERIFRWGADPIRAWPRLAGAFAFFFLTLFTGHLVRHLVFETHMYDMAFQHQPLFFPWLEGRLFHCDACRMQTLMGEHMAWTFAALSLIAAPIKSDVLLFFLQALIPAGALWIFIRKGPLERVPSAWFWFFVLFALFRPFREGLIFDFREDIMGFAFLLLSLTALSRGQAVWGLVAALLAMWSKENFPAVTFLMGGVLLLDRHLPLDRRTRIRTALLLMAASLATFVIFNRFLIPAFMQSSEARNNILNRFPGFGSTMSEFILNVLKNPFAFLSAFGGRFFEGPSLRYLATLLLPLFIFGRRAWIWTIPGWAMAALNVLSNSEGQRSGSFHYEFIILPFWMFAVALGIHHAHETSSERGYKRAWIWALLLALLLAGRGPLFEVTDRLHEYGHRLRAGIEVQFWPASDLPLASQTRVMPQFVESPHLRLLQSPEGPPVDDRLTNIRTYVTANPPIPIHEQGRDPGDARVFALRMDDPWEVFLKNELLAMGGAVLRAAPTDAPFLIMIQTNQPLFLKWCAEDGICPE